MDITISRELLLKPLHAINSIAEKKQTLPILSNTLLRVKNRQLFLKATDLEIEVEVMIPLEGDFADSEITVSARKLFEICKALPDDAVRLALEKNSLKISAGDCHFVLNTLPTDDFPHLDACDYPVEFTLKQQYLRELLSKTHFAMASQDVRHYLNGAFLDIGQHTIKCVAADGHRLAISSICDESLKDLKAAVILPRKSVSELIRLLGGEGDEEVTIKLAEGRFCIITADYHIFTTKLINAQYPDYPKLIPNGTMIATIDRELIKHALVRAAILSNEKFRGVRFNLEPGKLLITANNPDQEQASDLVSLDYAGSKIEIAFNITYLLEAISALTSKTIRFIFKGPSDGMLIESIDDERTRYLIMPMRL